MEKKDNPLYLERYSFIRFGPSVKQFGGKPSEGVIAITTAGMVWIHYIFKIMLHIFDNFLLFSLLFKVQIYA